MNFLPEEKVRIAVADDDPTFCQAIIDVLKPDYQIVGYVTNGCELITMVLEYDPHIAIVDISMPVMNGFEALKRLAADGNTTTRVIICSSSISSAYVGQAMRLGARGYVAKVVLHEDLPNAVQAVLRGQTFISPILERNRSSSMAPAAVRNNFRKR